AQLSQLEQWVQQGRQPDLTLWFDVPPAVAAARRAAAREPDRLEREDEAFFDRVRSGYAARQAAQPGRFARIDADAPLESVRAEVLRVVAMRTGAA
ncbi:dTMP kinase, partial [Ideonella sp.]|uniref:dTMP kinase n=1 Tax=Ideonella sp. TaxID=1929293 RepID=UPI003BB58611